MCNDQIICIPHSAPPHSFMSPQHKQGTHVQKSTTNNRKQNTHMHKAKAYQLWISFVKNFSLCVQNDFDNAAEMRMVPLKCEFSIINGTLEIGWLEGS